MEQYLVGMIFSSFQAKLITYEKRTPLESPFDIFRLSKNENLAEFTFSGLVKSYTKGPNMRLNPSFLTFIEYMLRDSLKVSYIKHMLSSSSLLKNKEVLTKL